MGLQWGFRTWKVLGGGRGPAGVQLFPKQDKLQVVKRSQVAHLLTCGRLSQLGAGEVGREGTARQAVQREHKWEVRPMEAAHGGGSLEAALTDIAWLGVGE